MQIEKFISYQIETQFPQLYREEGQELIAFMKSYYEFLESQPGQTLYEGRRMFEYRDIDRVLDRLLIFFKNKFLADVPFNDKNLRFIVKKVLDLYRKKGTQEGIQLFFKMFYNQEVEIYYPSKDILKPSDSEWKIGKYLQMEPSTDIINYRKILGKRIYGNVSKANAIADKVNFIVLNGSFVPVIFLNEVNGEFLKYDLIISEVLGEFEFFGRVDGSMTSISINQFDPRAVSGNQVGQIVSITSEYGYNGKGIVTKVNQNATGEIDYQVMDGGFGYTEENTLLLVSDQVIFVPNSDLEFNILEPVEDQFGNRGVITGQTNVFIAVKMDDGDEFANGSIITTTDRPGNTNIIVDYTMIVDKNSSSPGPLYPLVVSGGGSNTEIESSVKAIVDNKSSAFLIADVISDFLDVPLNSLNYNDVPPALTQMSGIANTANIDTPINEAFDQREYELGRIVGFSNIRPGSDYINDVFAVAIDPVTTAFDRVDQNITLSTTNSLFSVGGIVSQSGVNAIIRKVSGNTLTITPFSYEGFVDTLPLTYFGTNYDIINTSWDYSSKRFGNNAIIKSTTEFAVGKIEEVEIINSSFGFREGTEGILKNPITNEILGSGIISTSGQGMSEGFWSSFNSHLNGYEFDEIGNPRYYDSGKRIHDNFYYQEYAYEISSRIDINTYERPLKQTMHVAGTKIFGKFVYADYVTANTDIKISFNL